MPMMNLAAGVRVEDDQRRSFLLHFRPALKLVSRALDKARTWRACAGHTLGTLIDSTSADLQLGRLGPGQCRPESSGLKWPTGDGANWPDCF